jgi:hypothetical protein
MSTIKKTNKNTGKDVGEWYHNLVQGVWKSVWNFLKKLKIELPFDQVTTFLGIFPKDSKSVYYINNCIPLWPKYGNSLHVHQKMNG